MQKNIFKTTLLVLCLLGLGSTLRAQECYWVMFADKAGTTFDPYTYFDAKAIERYQLNGADLYDLSNYPLNQNYVAQVAALSTEEVGQSRWLNAEAIMATPEQVAAIEQLPFVTRVVMLAGDMQTASYNETDMDEASLATALNNFDNTLSDQLKRMGGKYFRAKGIDGKGIRIAVFDGGFPQVNTHMAFKHLRDEGRIIKTWNFPNNKENVYGWNSHGTMTLSCIAGKTPNRDLGLATGAEFLLARTEVNTEPKKEEVWWQMAVEWADKNGAQIISSSLGYGKDRYYTKDMDGTSLVAKAGNMAARKGILVCNSAGNEGTDKTWRTIITPSDADSVLCVGGIEHSLTDYSHISFSSYGPSADGRQKPNVVAFGHAYTANTGKDNASYHYVDGTSFSCPLVAGFAACALQSHPELTAMQLFHEIERSADLYPYCDYTYGYGVPQAAYFTGNRQPVQPTFRFAKDPDGKGMLIIPTADNNKQCYVFIKNSSADGHIIDYRQWEFNKLTTADTFHIADGEKITFHYNGYTDSIQIPHNQDGNNHYMNLWVDSETDNIANLVLNPQIKDNFINEKNSANEFYLKFGLPVNTASHEMKHKFWSPTSRLGYRRLWHFGKAYGLGLGLEYGIMGYHFDSKSNPGEVETMLNLPFDASYADKVYRRRLYQDEWSAEVFQRVRLVPAGLMHKGLHWDLGAYISYSYNRYYLKYSNEGDIYASSRELTLRNIAPLDGHHLLYGITTRLTYDIIGIYGRFRLDHIGKELQPGELDLPRLEMGLQLAF